MAIADLIEAEPPHEKNEPTASNEVLDLHSQLELELQAIRQRVKDLEEASSRPPVVSSTPVEVEEPSQSWTTHLGGQVFFDYVNWANASPTIQPQTQDVASWRRIRFNYDATGYEYYEFRVQFDLEPRSDAANGVTEPYVAMKDVFLGIRGLPFNTKLRFGNFFVPFSLEQLTPLPNTQFMERSIPSAGVFSPDREVGLASYHLSDDLNRSLALGIFFDDISESRKQVVDDNQGLRLSARGTWLPFFDEASNGRYLIHTGVGFVHTQDRNDLVRFRARPGEIRDTQRLIDTGSINASDYSVMNFELATVDGPLSFQSEWFLSRVDRLQDESVDLHGGYIQASYFLTGENRQYDRDGAHLAHFGRTTPRTNFFLTPRGAGWGAWEVKARWAHLDFSSLSRGQYSETTLGFNWYLNEHARICFEWIHPQTTRDVIVGNSPIGSIEADVLAMRLQFTY